MSNFVQNEKSSNSLWKGLIKNWFIIAIAFVLCLGASFAYAQVKIKPVYTAKTAIVLKATISNNVSASTNTSNATLSKNLLPTLKECLKSARAEQVANDYYNQLNNTQGKQISKGSLGVNYGDSSMIFTLSYSSSDQQLAKKKLEAYINSLTETQFLNDVMEAEDVALVPVQNQLNVSTSDATAKTITLGGLLGLAIGMGITFLIYIFDNKIRSAEELEEIIGSSVLSYIDSDKK